MTGERRGSVARRASVAIQESHLGTDFNLILCSSF